jgi:hypothetical protein
LKNKKRKSGVSSTKGSIHTIRDKDVFNRSTGNKGHNRSRSSNKQTGSIESNNRLLTKLSPKGKANLLKIQEIVRENSQYATSEDFAGRGLLVQILDIEKRKKGKYGPGVTIKFLDCKSNRERIWNTGSIAALRAIGRLLEQGITRMYIWKTGRERDTRYYAKPAEAATQKDNVRTKLLQKKRRKANAD